MLVPESNLYIPAHVDQTPLLPYVVHRLPQGVLIRTVYPGLDPAGVTHHVLTYAHLGSLFAHVAVRAEIKGYDLSTEAGYRSALRSAWSTLRPAWMKRKEILEAKQEAKRGYGELLELIELHDTLKDV